MPIVSSAWQLFKNFELNKIKYIMSYILNSTHGKKYLFKNLPVLFDIYDYTLVAKIRFINIKY